MKVRLLLLLLFSCVGMQARVAAQVALPSYYDRYPFLVAPPSAFNDGLLGFVHPANLGLLQQSEMRFYWATDAEKLSGVRDWGLFAGVPHLGFSAQRQELGAQSVTDYRLGLGFGTRGSSWGLAYGWSGGDADVLGRENLLILGTIMRPASFLSVALTGNYSTNSSAYEWVSEVGVRPLGSPVVTVFADAAWPRGASLEDVPWSAGASLRVFSGIDITGRYFDNESFTLGLTFDLGRSGVSGQSHFDSNQEYAYQTWGLRLGGLRTSLATSSLNRDRYYVPIETRGTVRYLKYQLFDSGGRRFYEILDDIAAASADPRVASIAINLSGTKMAPEHAWEIREALAAAQRAGMRVLVYLDYAGMTGYHLASVADYVVMDPQGMLTLPGYVLNRTYMRGSLEKLGLKFDEWRYFEYKSAAESLVRRDMSDADREQSQAFVDDWYEQTRRDVTAGRNLNETQFDALIDEQVLFTPDRAMSAGLVDTLARWRELGDIIPRLMGKRLKSLASDQVLLRAQVDDQWGERPGVALVYGVGVCAMNEGIRARYLEEVFLKLARDRKVKAVVFRVDSPGGDPLASDLVAAAMKKCSSRKPVIVSQGQVAASGGYWISMYGDSVLAGPTTVTGSIGVIGGWLYDDGATDKLGMSSDFVQRGKHADYEAGVRLPLLGARIPSRPLTEDEMVIVDETIKDLYYRFTNAVARSRNLDLTEVNDLAKGRIYSGLDARQLDLVDEIGGLLAAIEAARLKARIPDHQRIEITEFPSRRGLFKMPFSAPAIGVLEGAPADEWQQLLELLLDFNGRGLPLLLPGSYPAAAE